MTNKVLESAKFISESSSSVSVSRDGVKKLAKDLFDTATNESKIFNPSSWKDQELNPKIITDQTKLSVANWIFFVDTLNFSFWTHKNETPYTVLYNNKRYTGYWSLCAAVNRALDEKIPLTSPDYYKSISKEDFKKIFRSETETAIPLLDRRIEVLHETGKILMEKYSGNVLSLIEAANKDVLKFLDIITSQFPSYNDCNRYKDRTVYFYKRAQIFIADIWAAFEGKGLGEFHNIHEITMFADYRVPQCLLYFGVLQYSNPLMALLNQNIIEKKEMIPQTDLECEIRGNSIWGVEMVRIELESLKAACKDPTLTKDLTINSIMIDFYLWTYAQSYKFEMGYLPIHLCRTHFY